MTRTSAASRSVTKNLSTPESQRVYFIETTHQLGADEKETKFKEKLAVSARQEPEKGGR